jgi:hypothetical protein
MPDNKTITWSTVRRFLRIIKEILGLVGEPLDLSLVL